MVVGSSVSVATGYDNNLENGCDDKYKRTV